MKTMLKISIILNLVLAGGLVFMLHQKPAADPAPRVVAEAHPPMDEAVTVIAQTPPRAEPKPFRWSQLLETRDYHVYVKNLRAIGCPEPTLRAIVTADVDLVYRRRNRELEQKLADLRTGSWSVQLAASTSEQALRDAMLKLPEEEAAVIAGLLGLQHPPAQSAPAVADNNQEEPQDQPIAMPLVLQDVDLAALNLQPEQIQVVNELRQEFIDKIGGTNLNPDDPTYLARWQKAQPATDEMLQAMIGNEAWQNFQLQAEANPPIKSGGNQ